MWPFKKKDTTEKGSAKTGKDIKASDTEFERDVRELMARDDIQCREDICKAEFEKAQKLAEKATENDVHRAYDLMGNLASQFDYIPAILWMGDFAESIMHNMQQAAFWFKKAADMGDGNGARCYADMLMTGNGVARDPQTAIKYYTDAANRGVPEAAFVLGEVFRNAGDRNQALKAYRAALDGGYEPARIRINQMMNFQR